MFVKGHFVQLMTDVHLQELERASHGRLSDFGSPNGAALPDEDSQIFLARPASRMH